jgi:hypothetical protein
MLCDGYGIAEGFGYDLASAAIADARSRTGGRPRAFPLAGIGST